MKKNDIRNYTNLAVVVALLIWGAANIMASQSHTTVSAAGSSSFLGAFAPTIAVEKSSYKAGETVVITGKGFNRFERVSLEVESANDSLRTTLAHWDVYADGRGRIFTTYILSPSFSAREGGKYSIKAIGNETSLSARATIEASVTPVVRTDNPSCATLNADNTNFPTITSDFGFKIDSPVAQGTFTLTNNGSPPRVLTGGAPSDSSNTVTVTFTDFSNLTQSFGGSEPILFDWSATLGIDAVIVKGQSTNVYVYNPEATGDTSLETPQMRGLSHIEFCYDYGDLKIIKDAVPDSATDFPFTTSGTGATNNSLPAAFTLDDDNDPTLSNMIKFDITQFGAGNPITITESQVLGWEVRPGTGIQCTQTGPGSNDNNTIDIPNRRVTVVVDTNENVTCTFINDELTATSALAAVSGRVLDANGRAIRNVILSVTDLATGSVTYARTTTFGYYSFELPVGENYLISVSAKGYRFEPSIRVLTVNESLANTDFIGQLSSKKRRSRF